MLGFGVSLTSTRRPLWTPAQLFTGGAVGVWYDPSDLATVFQDSAGTIPGAVDQPIGKILDKSGGGYHLTQSTSAARPLLKQDAGGRYYIQFDSVDDYLITQAMVALGDAWASCAAYVNRTRRNYNGPWKLISDTNQVGGVPNRLLGEYWQAGNANSGHFDLDRRVPADIYRQLNDTGPAAGTAMVTQIRKAVSPGVPAGGVYWAGGNFDSLATPDAFIGTQSDLYANAAGYLCLGVAFSNYANQDLYGLIIMDRDFDSDGEAASARNWAAKKAGITL